MGSRKRIMNLTFASSLTELKEVNSSFDSGILRIAYTGRNRNGSYISRQAFEQSIKTIYNCPIVCNYDRETDELGGHDVEFVEQDGKMVLVNTTTPVGVIPESAEVFWTKVEEDDGTEHEYLCAEILLWKRQEAYQKIKRDGIVAHSMEISVKDGRLVDGVYYIDDFEFTAFALIGVEPCFESSCLTVFSQEDYKKQFAAMMQELKDSKSLVTFSDKEVDNINKQYTATEGGEQELSKEEITSRGVDTDIDIESSTLATEDFDSEEFEQQAPPEPTAQDNSAEDKSDFVLQSAIENGLRAAFESDMVQNEWGENPRYVYADMDVEAEEVYAWDTTNWLLYGFGYSMNGDNVTVDYESKTRKKYVIADYDEGDQTSPFALTYASLVDVIKNNNDWATKYQEASDSIQTMSKELDELKQFKASIDQASAQEERDAIFAQFEDLNGVEAFEELKADSMKYEVDVLEDMCYALRGRQVSTAKFNLEHKVPKIKVDKNNDERNTPYGGLFEKYGISKED